MSNQVLSILNKSFKKKDKYNIITFNTHERYQIQLSKTGHDFYAFNFDGGKDWFDGHGKMPENYYQLPKNLIHSGIDFDFILVNSKFGQYQVASQINRALKLPIVCLEHTLPLPQWSDQQLKHFQSMLGNINVFITEYSKNKWGIDGEVVYHSIDAELFKSNKNLTRKGVLTVAHDFINRDYALNYRGWERITKGLDRKVVGETKGLSQQSKSVDDLIKCYQEASVYINPSVLSPVPTSMLEAMACECAVVTTATCEIPNIIKHGVNGFISNDESKLRGYIERLLEDNKLREEIGINARKTILDRFSEEKFLDKWNKIFNQAYEVKK